MTSEGEDEHEYTTGSYVEGDTYVPTTGAVRASYAQDYYMTEVGGGATVDGRTRAFNRWLAAHDAELLAVRSDGVASGERAALSNLIAEIVIEQMQVHTPGVFAHLGLRYGIADAILDAGFCIAEVPDK